jgi:sulfite reductase beta subunit-like hemoprotein
VARQVIAAMGPVAGAARWAISGCHNSCAQPQLADFGIVVSGLVKGDDGSRSPRFDLYSHSGRLELGSPVAQNLSLAELLDMVKSLG